MIFAATGDAIAAVRNRTGGWEAELRLEGLPTQCVAVDPVEPHVVYCGTFGRGLWRSEDAGRNWQPVGEGIPYAEITAVAVSALERSNGYGVVWAGTEPSALFRSEDGGRSWQERTTLRDLPSAPTWSFPPRPWTSHVRWIAPDPVESERLFVGIELGGVMRSLDGGLTWEDRKPDSQYDAHTLRTHHDPPGEGVIGLHDAHTLRTHRLAPGRVYEAAGGGYAESLDGGATWRRFDDGMDLHYVWGLAVDPEDPDVMIVSAAPGPRQAHDPSNGESRIYRRSGEEAWREVQDGLPYVGPTGAYVLAAHDAEPGVFCAATRRADLYRSADAGQTWQRFDVAWPQGYQAADVRGLVVVDPL